MKSFALIIIGLVLFQSQLSTCQEFFLDYGIDEGTHAIDEGPVFVDADIKNEIDVLVANVGTENLDLDDLDDIEDPQTGEVIIGCAICVKMLKVQDTQ